jgi:hypothetical protein
MYTELVICRTEKRSCVTMPQIRVPFEVTAMTRNRIVKMNGAEQFVIDGLGVRDWLKLRAHITSRIPLYRGSSGRTERKPSRAIRSILTTGREETTVGGYEAF